MSAPMMIANSVGNTPRRMRTTHHTKASVASARGRTAKNCHPGLSVSRWRHRTGTRCGDVPLKGKSPRSPRAGYVLHVHYRNAISQPTLWVVSQVAETLPLFSGQHSSGAVLYEPVGVGARGDLREIGRRVPPDHAAVRVRQGPSHEVRTVGRTCATCPHRPVIGMGRAGRRL